MTFKVSWLLGALAMLTIHDVAFAELEPLFWHIDRFNSGEHANAAAGPSSVALQAHGTWWLMTIESSEKDHHGGQHVAAVALPKSKPRRGFAIVVYDASQPPTTRTEELESQLVLCR